MRLYLRLLLICYTSWKKMIDIFDYYYYYLYYVHVMPIFKQAKNSGVHRHAVCQEASKALSRRCSYATILFLLSGVTF